MIIPIRTEASIRRMPYVNPALIAANIVLFLLFNQHLLGESAEGFRDRFLIFQSSEPAFAQFFTYQFLHADVGHLLGNMLFLWVFGNAVNAKMGDLPYLLFYLAGGAFAAWGWATLTPDQGRLVGASGSIAAVTTAYLALFPRSRVTVLFWFFLIHFFELPAMIIIGLKIIVWDNVIAPSFGGSDVVAHSAHLAGYFFGFVGALGLLLVRALPRDQFDILALWKRWHQRREFASVMADPEAAARAQFGTAARVPAADPIKRAAEERQLDQVSQLREQIVQLLGRRDLAGATQEYGKLVALDPRQCLAEIQQLEIAREFYRMRRFPQAAAAFERFLECYPRSREMDDVRLLVGIVYARDLKQYEAADKHLTQSIETLQDDKRRSQCLEWLREVREVLSRPAPDG
ncbi:MAG: rhomboid family intramembrane serine protease [Phycisphaerales bacterium]|nr:MAG: rhomboid family intramembrane serine protease [Phycisphaerales bacterium]